MSIEVIKKTSKLLLFEPKSVVKDILRRLQIRTRGMKGDVDWQVMSNSIADLVP